MKSLYPHRSPEKLRQIIDDVTKESFKNYVNIPGYFCATDPISGKNFVLVFRRHPDGTIEQVKNEK